MGCCLSERLKKEEPPPLAILPASLTDQLLSSGKQRSSDKPSKLSKPQVLSSPIPRVRILTDSILNLFDLAMITRLADSESVILYMEKATLLKVMVTTYAKPRSTKLKETRTEFACEAGLILGLDHPGLLKGKQLLEDKNYFGIVWEGAQGGVLLEYAGKLNQEIIIQLAVQLFEVFAYCHKKEVTHLRMRPAHLLLQETPESKLWVLKLAGLDETRHFAAKPLPLDTISPFIAPEVYAGEPCKGSDMWSCGVALYILITGVMPFTEDVYFEAIKASSPLQPLFDSEVWTSGTSMDCRDLISSLLQWNPSDRPSALQCLKHSYLQSVHSRTSNRSITMSMSKFADVPTARSQLQIEIKEFVLDSVRDTSYLAKLREAFRALDSNGDGMINREELQRGLERVFPATETASKCSNIFKIVDFNDSGELDYTEFVLASYSNQDLFTVDNLEFAFNRLDVNRSGYIRAEDLMLMLKSTGKKKLRKELLSLRQCSTTMIDFNEFRNIILKSQIVR